MGERENGRMGEWEISCHSPLRCGIRVMRSLATFAVLLAVAVSAGCGKKDQAQEGQPEGATSDNPAAQETETLSAVSDLLRPGLPKVLDFGRGKCIPCKKMAPILRELAEEYQGRAVIRMIDIGEPGGRELVRQFKIQLIPTQVFLDREGKEIWRHEGFLPKKEIVQKLREMGVAEE
jgi:thioredoxin 1